MFDSLYKQLPDGDDEAQRTNGKSLLYETYCPTNNRAYGKCNSDFDKINAGFVYLLVQLFGNVYSEGEQEDSGNIQKLQNILNIVKNTFEAYRFLFYNTYTDIGNNLYNKASSTLENVYDKSKNFAGITINYVKENLNKALENDPSSDSNGLEPTLLYQMVKKRITKYPNTNTNWPKR
ncbi:CIR protein PIR protein, fragment [Plasmodium vinckei vinckei]|uniref:CIR protein PIR protein n=1 Tax=Plasmodium vinckei vinckei TaxID=54757 RepID=A0A449BQV0_PLAVN|nr:CIR protein PIR protein, fragment [Plasmodium vinckei vinckei]VEV55847.1 CIR protein PIR protein, fragment [Plasmodium vinckei vinckei]